MTQMYLKSASAVGYDKKGITAPVPVKMNLQNILEYFAATDVHWENEFGFHTHPQVLVFDTSDLVHSEIREMESFFRELGLLVLDMWGPENG